VTSSSEFQCAQCGAVYAVTVQKIHAPVSDVALCDVCKRIMSEWRGNLLRNYELKERPAALRSLEWRF